MVVKWRPTLASNWRSQQNLIEWLENNKLIAIGGIDTRRLTRIIRKQGAPHVAIEHNTDSNFDTDSLINDARNFAGLSGLDLAKNVTSGKTYSWNQTVGDGLEGTVTLKKQSTGCRHRLWS